MRILHICLVVLFGTMYGVSQKFDIRRYESKIIEFEKTKAETGQVVLYGSSSFAYWVNYATHLAPYKVLNRGFGGSTAAEALYYFDRVIVPLKPKVIFYYEGDNDLAIGFSADSVFELYKKIATKVKSNLPGTKFVALSVKHSPARKNLIEIQKKYNYMVAGFALRDKNLGYIDIASLQYTPKGKFDPAMFLSDSLHVSDSAYLKWSTRLKNYLDSEFNTKPKQNWVTLFNGKNLEGWEQRGGHAKYEVIDQTIVGTSTLNTPNSFMCTQKTYSNFVLEFEVKVDTLLNSGVQFRSNSKAEFKNGVVYGYQCEIDPSPRAYSGGIYDEQRRGWLYNPEGDPRAKLAFDRHGWNKYRIEAIGYTIKTYVNGIVVSDIVDLADSSGFIGLQVHSIDSPVQEGRKVMWRNIRIAEMP